MKRFAAFLIAGSLVVISAFLFRSFSLAQSRISDPTAIYTHGVLRVSIPYTAPRSGEGDLAIEVLDPEDAVVSGFDRARLYRFRTRCSRAGCRDSRRSTGRRSRLAPAPLPVPLQRRFVRFV